MRLNPTLLAVCAIGILSAAAPARAAPLPAYNADIRDSTVSGLSAGGFFAMQLGVAYAATFKGVGIIAGGTYDCAGQTSYFGCMYNATPGITQSIANIKSWSGIQNDNYTDIARQKIYLWTGTSDTTVGPNVTDQVYKLYVTTGNFVSSANVKYDKLTGAAHTFPTDFDSAGNNACGIAASPYISNCSFDGAGATLKQLYGVLNARNNGALGGSLIQFDQTEFIPAGRGMDGTGWVYVPASCASGAQCRVHVALHGCQQSQSQIGMRFVNNTGYNKWADTNDIIVLYPQTVADNTPRSTKASGMLANPNACFDWIGWYGTNFDQKAGVQMLAVKKMVDRLTSAFATLPAPAGLAVNGVSNTSISLVWHSASGESGYNVYRNGAKVNAAAVATSAYTDAGLSPGTTYSYQVTALATNGAESAKSASVSGTTTGTPPAVPAPYSEAVTATVLNHYLAGRINVTQYNQLGVKYGYLTPVTLYHCGPYWTDSANCTPIS